MLYCRKFYKLVHLPVFNNRYYFFLPDALKVLLNKKIPPETSKLAVNFSSMSDGCGGAGARANGHLTRTWYLSPS